MNGTRMEREWNENIMGTERKQKRNKNGMRMKRKQNGNGMRMEWEWNGNGTRTKTKREQNGRTDGDCADDDTAKQSMSTSSVMMVCRRKKRNFFLLLHVFFFFFFQNCYMGYSLHDYKLKNTQKCTARMLTSKPMNKENKCMWGCITWCKSCTIIKPCVCVCACSQDLKLVVKQALELLTPSSLWSSRIQNFIACSLFSVSILPRLHYY
jgi:hypothetical protein